jgi:hypothetical protein
VLRTSFLSATHATDSTWSGCTAKSAATRALRHKAPVIREKSRNKSKTPTTWSTRFVVWYTPGDEPPRLASSWSDSQVNGCQLAWDVVVNAQTTPSRVRPARTRELSRTYPESS